MKQVAILALATLTLAICSCGTPHNNAITTKTSGLWGAQLTGGIGPTTELNFDTGFNVSDTTGVQNEPLDITSFGFINAGPCFSNLTTQLAETGSATLTTNSSGQVSGSMTYTITTSQSSNVLTLSTAPQTVGSQTLPGGGFSGTSNGTPTTTGTLSNAIAWGNWVLQSGDTNCTGGLTSPITGNFIMCQQGVTTCVIP